MALQRFLPISSALRLLPTWMCLSCLLCAQQFEVAQHRLKNGMTILVQEDRSIPNIALYIFYKVGSRNERPGTTGISHYFEHMMFNGSKKFGPGQFDRVMEDAGGSNNAYTTRDLTVYQDWFPNSALELILQLEADRIENLRLDPLLVDSERAVVANERRLAVENSNWGLLDEQLWATAFTAHPYQWPVLGWMSDIESWTIPQLQAHFRMGYSPSNAVLVAVGSVSAQEFIGLARKHLEPIPSHDPPPKVVTREPDQLGERRVTIRKPAQLPLLMAAFRVPASDHPDFYPLRILQVILAEGRSSRLHARLVEKDRLAVSIEADLPFAFDPTLMTFTVQLRAGAEARQVENALYEELHRIGAEAVDETEISKAKNTLLADFYRQMKTIDGKADGIGIYHIYLGDYRKLFSFAEDVSRVTSSQLQQAAGRYFRENLRTVASLIPSQRPLEPKEETQQ